MHSTAIARAPVAGNDHEGIGVLSTREVSANPSDPTLSGNQARLTA
jgi:hypothetical protein